MHDSRAHLAISQRWQQVLPQHPAGLKVLLQRYAEPHRAYHNARHIAACVAELDAWERGGHPPLQAVALALLFHDVVYDPRRPDNEQQSALLADEMLRPHVSREDIATITRLIQATDHKHPPVQEDEALIIDIDLSILGQPREDFESYETAIRQEYAHVPADEFRTGRSAILRRFLAAPCIYHTPYFYAKYESAARLNLEWSLSMLSSPNPEPS